MRTKLITVSFLLITLSFTSYLLSAKILPKNNLTPNLAVAEIVPSDSSRDMSICGYDMPKSTKRLTNDNKWDILNGLARSVYVYQEWKPYANFVDINSDGLIDYLYGYYTFSTSENYCLSMLINKGENKFEVEYNCSLSGDNQTGLYYQGTCADPNYIVK